MAPSRLLQLKSLEDTALLGEVLSQFCKGATTICLCGELGSGKTTLVRAMVAAMGSKQAVSSPTFVLSHDYPINDFLTLEHWDLYRLAGAPEDLVEPPSSSIVRVIEWPERDQAVLEAGDLIVSLVVPDPASSVRILEIRGPLAKDLVASGLLAHFSASET